MSASAQLGPQPSAQRNALFIDADPEIHAMLANVLDPQVWSVQHAPDNKAALTLVGATHFDLILTSEKTSGKEDVNLLRRIRKLRPHTRLIILTEASTPADVITSMRERAFSYFSRPFSPTSLAEMVRTAAEEPCWDDGIEIVSATPDWIRLVARCDLKTADRLMQFMHEVADLEIESNPPAFQSFAILKAGQPQRFLRSRQRVPPSGFSVPFSLLKAFLAARLFGCTHELIAAFAGFSDQDFALRSDDFFDRSRS